MPVCAVVFVRRSGARGIGHVGWAFDCGDGTFNAGSVENPRHTLRTPPVNMGFWTIRTADPIDPMRKRSYDEFKLITLDQGDPAYAWQVVAWVSQQPYEVIGRNCMDVTYDVLRALGVAHLPVPAHHWEPNHWFNHVHGQHYRIDADDVTLESDGHRPTLIGPVLPDREILIDRPLAGVTPAVPRWRIANTPEWHEFQAAMAAAPPMPAAKTRSCEAAHVRIVDKIRRVLGIGGA